jgi:hypothetical protein
MMKLTPTSTLAMPLNTRTASTSLPPMARPSVEAQARQGGRFRIDARIADEALDELAGHNHFFNSLNERINLEYPIVDEANDEETSGFTINFQRAIVDSHLMKKLVSPLPPLQRNRLFKEAAALWEGTVWGHMPKERLIPKVFNGTLTHAVGDDGNMVIETTVFQNRFKKFPSTQSTVTRAKREELMLDTEILRGLYSGLSPESFARVRASQQEFNTKLEATLPIDVTRESVSIPEVTPSHDTLIQLAQQRQQLEQEHPLEYPLIHYEYKPTIQ